MPNAKSRLRLPVGMEATLTLAPLSPRLMMEPLPNWRSIWVTAASMAFFLSLEISISDSSTLVVYHGLS